MTEKHIVGNESKRIFYGELEEYARSKIREHLQDLLKQEVSQWLGREKSERRSNRSEQPGYRNLTTHYNFPHEHWKHLRTSNVVESRFSRFRLRTAASMRFKSQVNTTCLIWKTMMVAEMSFRKPNAPHRVAKVAGGTKYDDGKKVRAAA